VRQTDARRRAGPSTTKRQHPSVNPSSWRGDLFHGAPPMRALRVPSEHTPAAACLPAITDYRSYASVCDTILRARSRFTAKQVVVNRTQVTVVTSYASTCVLPLVERCLYTAAEKTKTADKKCYVTAVCGDFRSAAPALRAPVCLNRRDRHETRRASRWNISNDRRIADRVRCRYARCFCCCCG
jgi:hypothetical protein